MTVYDITPTISPEIAVFPGDQRFERQVAMSFSAGHHMDLSSITTTVHLGAHADAPNHYHADGVGIDQRDPLRYLGLCQVIHVDIPKTARIMPKHIEGIAVRAPRVLFATGSFPNPNRWNDDFNSLSPELIHHLADAGVITVGIDTPSVDPAPAKELISHHAIYDRDLAILEGVVLDQVPRGTYFLSALPLKIKDGDAGPLRAVLTTLDHLREELKQAP